MAWQLGGKEGYKLVAADDEKATNPGDALTKLFNKYAPCIILIDEWVAYARQLHEQHDLPGGTFETQFTFAQALTESAKAAKQTLLVVSIPASESPHQKVDNAVTDVEVGGSRGREALVRLKNAIGRVEASFQTEQTETKKKNNDDTVNARIPETFQWLLVPGQPDPKGAMEWSEIKLQGRDGLAVRAAKKMRGEELLMTQLGGIRLRHELDRVPL